MRILDLNEKYEALISAAIEVSYESLSNESKADLDWLLAHISISDNLLERAVQSTLNGEAALIDNAGAMDPTKIAALIGSSTYFERVGLVEKHARRFLSKLGQLSDVQAQMLIQLRVWDRVMKLANETSLSWQEVKSLRVDHIAAHTTTIRTL